MGRLDGKVAVISGAARGQGRSHAVTLAREGADIVAFDLCGALETVQTPPATAEDLAETARLVEKQDRRCLVAKVDARDLDALVEFAAKARAEFDHLDLLSVNHGMWSVAASSWELDERAWQESIDVLLTGAWKVCKAFIPHVLAGGRGGSIVLTASSNGFTPQPSAVAYCAAKAGVLNMMRVLAWELGEYDIRVNALCPGGVDTPMVTGGGTLESALALRPRYHEYNRNLLPVELLPPQSVSNALLWLFSDESRHVTGVQLPVDAGWTTF
jgi:SDR family mycofactocin-dependent oxidoreductase